MLLGDIGGNGAKLLVMKRSVEIGTLSWPYRRGDAPRVSSSTDSDIPDTMVPRGNGAHVSANTIVVGLQFGGQCLAMVVLRRVVGCAVHITLRLPRQRPLHPRCEFEWTE